MHWREALRHYAECHETHCIQFAEEVLEQAGRTDLAERTGPTRREFVEFLENDVVDRDLTELF